jgi:hypothetical protein
MNKFIRILAIGTMLAFGTSTAMAAAAAAADPVIGTWQLNLEKSKFGEGRAPKSQTRVYAAVAEGTSMMVTGVAADGSAVSQSATLTYDGKDCAVTGADWDTLTLKRVNGTTTKAEAKKAGKVVGHTTRTISAHGKVLTLSSAMKTAKGGTVHDVAVFDKQ